MIMEEAEVNVIDDSRFWEPIGSNFLTAAFAWIGLLAVLAHAAPARADLITNGSFESVTPGLSTNRICTTNTAAYPSVDPGYYPACSATGWTGNYQIGNAKTIGYSGVSFGVPQPDPNGSNALILQTELNLAPTATQSISIPTTGLYTLTFYVANRSTPAGNNGPQTVSVLLDNAVITGGTYDNLPAAWILETLNLSVNAGVHSLTFQGLTTKSGSVSARVAAFVDDVSLVPSFGPPVIVPSGVVSASGFGGFSSIAPGSWIEIYGSNLANDTRSWQNSDFNGVNAPTSLDGTSVTIGGQDAFIDYISPSQVNALVPFTVTIGPQQLTLKTPAGTSPPAAITVNAVEPGLLAPPSFNVSGTQYSVAFFADGTYVLPTGAISGLTSQPAKPGDEIVLYGVGFGPVTPTIPAGQLVGEANSLADFQISLGGVPCTVQYDGLTPNYTGLYQFNITVPSVPSGNQPLTFTVGGTPGSQTLYIAVEN